MHIMIIPAALIRCLKMVRIPIFIFSSLLSNFGIRRPINFPEKERAGIKMSRIMRKSTFCICENKDAEQLRSN